eukprot:scaffold1006_cov270-Pinguiococcus_pyrenoidosus.AAC.34
MKRFFSPWRRCCSMRLRYSISFCCRSICGSTRPWNTCRWKPNSLPASWPSFLCPFSTLELRRNPFALPPSSDAVGLEPGRMLR